MSKQRTRRAKKSYVGAASGSFDGLEMQRRPIAPARIEVFASHVGEGAVALDRRGEPVRAVEVAAQQAMKGIRGGHTNAYAVTAALTEIAIEVMRMTDIHGPPV